VAVMVAEPADTPVTTPVALTVATPGALELHVMTRPVRMLLLASFNVGTSVVVAPTVMLAVKGAMITLATGAFATVTTAVALWLSLVAVMVAEPADMPVTTPVELTVATVGALELHAITRPVRTLLLASFVVATSVVVAPTTMLAVGGARVTLATGTTVTVIVAVPT
jgi:hypothetical protein